MRSGRANDPDLGGRLDLLEGWLQAQCDYLGWPGAAVGIVHDQELIYANGIGCADLATRTPCGPDTIYRIASHSKLFTGIAAMRLRDDGKLDLDAPVSGYLPWFKPIPKVPDAIPITVRHLLSHRSGLPREAGFGYWSDYNFPDLDELKAYVDGLEATYSPEERFKYSNLAVSVAGLVVAEVAQTSYPAVIHDLILDPLEMNDTTTNGQVSDPSRLATGYGRRMPDGSQAVMPHVEAGAVDPAGGFSSTIRDMAKFIAWQFRLMDGSKAEILRPSTLREMQRVQWLESNWSFGWGISFYSAKTDAREVIGHTGGYPGFLTATLISPGEKMGVMAYVNGLDAELLPSQPRGITGRMFDWIGPKLSEACDVDLPSEAWSDYYGTYRFDMADILVLAIDGKLSTVCPYSADPMREVITLEQVDDDRFVMDGKVGFSAVGESVLFERDGDGRVTALRTPGALAERI